MAAPEEAKRDEPFRPRLPNDTAFGSFNSDMDFSKIEMSMSSFPDGSLLLGIERIPLALLQGSNTQKAA